MKMSKVMNDSIHALINDIADNVSIEGKLQPAAAWKMFFKKQLGIESFSAMNDEESYKLDDFLIEFCRANQVPIATHYRKKGNYDNPKLLALAQYVPKCFACNEPNDGTVVMAHANKGEYGKGRSIKASDASACPMCSKCHFKVDQSTLSAEDRDQIHLEAFRRWVIYAFEHSIFQIGINVQIDRN